MSQQQREDLVHSGHLFPQRPSQFNDLLDDTKTQDSLIGLLTGLVAKGFHIELTAVNTDHHNDSALGPHCHNPCGKAFDCWPLTGPVAGAWLDATDPFFQKFLEDAASDPNHFQTGLAGSADIPVNQKAAGPTYFSDDGADHVHVGCK